MNILSWLIDWYQSNCNGDWEHEYGIKIETIDNPGWKISIDLNNTELDRIDDKEWELIQVSDNDWYGVSIKEKKFSAAGDPSKLEFLISKFRELTNKY